MEKFHSDAISPRLPPVSREGCIFCNIAAGMDSTAKVIYQNSEVVVFQDIEPASREHLLVIPTTHIQTVQDLTGDDIPKLKYLYSVGKAVLKKRGGDISKSRVGFHWPPYNSVDHLHLHIIYPVEEMGLSLYRQRRDDHYFYTYEYTLDWLKKQPKRNHICTAS